LRKDLNRIQLKLRLSDEAKALLAKKGFDPVYGARPLRRAVQSMVEDRLAEEMLEGRVKSGDVKDDELVFVKDKSELVSNKG